MARRRKTFSPGPVVTDRSAKSFNPGGPMVRSGRGTGTGAGRGSSSYGSAPKMGGGSGPTYPATVSAFGKKYRSEAGRQGTEAQHVTRLKQTLAQLPKAQRAIYLQGQAHLAFGAKHPQSWVEQWLKRNRSRFGL